MKLVLALIAFSLPAVALANPPLTTQNGAEVNPPPAPAHTNDAQAGIDRLSDGVDTTPAPSNGRPVKMQKTSSAMTPVDQEGDWDAKENAAEQQKEAKDDLQPVKPAHASGHGFKIKSGTHKH